MQDSRETVLKIAAAQKMLLGSICLSIGLNMAVSVCRPSLKDLGLNTFAAELGIIAVALVILAFQAVCVIRLGLILNEMMMAVLCAIGQVIPCVNLGLLLWLNSRVAARLQKSGIRVDMLPNEKDLANYHPHEFRIVCPSCRAESSSEFDFCPKCGTRLVANPPEQG